MSREELEALGWRFTVRVRKDGKVGVLAVATEPDGGETEIWRGYFGSEDVALPAPYFQDESCTIGACDVYRETITPRTQAGIQTIGRTHSETKAVWSRAPRMAGGCSR